MPKAKFSTPVTVSNRTLVRVILVTLATLLVLHFLQVVGHILVLIALAIFLALALNPFVDWLQRHGIRQRLMAVVTTYLAAIVIVGGFLTLITPPLVNQTVHFINAVPSTLQDLKTQNTAIARFTRRLKITDEIDNFTSDFSKHGRNVSSFALNLAGRIASTLVEIITILVLTFMLLLEGPAWLEKLWALQPAQRQKHYRPIAQQMYRIVTAYVNGQLIISLIGAILTYLVALLAGVPNPEVVAGIIFLTGLIPLVGHPIGAVLVTLVALFASPTKAIIMAIFFVIYLQVQSATIQPYVQSRMNELSPLTVFLAALIGIAAGGLLGAFVAIPVVGCLKILLEDYMQRHRVGVDLEI